MTSQVRGFVGILLEGHPFQVYVIESVPEHSIHEHCIHHWFGLACTGAGAVVGWEWQDGWNRCDRMVELAGLRVGLGPGRVWVGCWAEAWQMCVPGGGCGRKGGRLGRV